MEKVIVFGKKEFDNGSILLDDFIKTYEKKDFSVKDHVAQRVNRKQVAFIASSSGTTGVDKISLFYLFFIFILFTLPRCSERCSHYTREYDERYSRHA